MFVRTDDSDAFGQPELLRINFTIPDGQTCNKAILKCGDLKLEFISPVSPIEVNLTSEQSALLKDRNCCDLVLYDGSNKQMTIPDIAILPTRAGVL